MTATGCELLRLLLPILLLLTFNYYPSGAVKVINNGLAPPEIVHTPISSQPKCIIRAAPLDLIFILDSSGSLKNKFQDEIDVIRRIVKHVTIGESATRVMLVQFSGVQHLEFDFNKFTNREDLLGALDVLRHVSGITRVGGAFEFTLSVMKPENGLRPASVPKILYLLSDGRTHDFPKDALMADLMRRNVPNLEIWAYGTGEYVAMAELINITKDATKIITSKNLERLEPLFDRWHGIEVCDKQPVCIKGSDKPLDLALLIDSSESIKPVFQKQIDFTVERIIQNVNIHPEAVRLSLITFSGQVFTHFTFNDRKYRNNSEVADYLKMLRPIKGTTSAHLAMAAAFDLLTDRSPESQIRPNANKLVIVISDGRSSRTSQTIAMRLRNEGISIIAVSMNYPPNADIVEMNAMTQDPELVFTPKNIEQFEPAFVKFVGFGCPGLSLGPNSAPRVRGATDISCSANSVTLTVRTQRPMNGLMYTQQFHSDPKCSLTADGKSRELTLTIVDGNCGLTKTPSEKLDGYHFNVTVILQFHPLIITRADQGLDVHCFHQQQISPLEISESSLKRLADTQCNYRLHRFGPEDCSALDAKVGESLFHKWECDSAPNYQFLVHDCFGSSERNNVQILDSNGCEIDAHFLKTPDYSHSAATTSDGLAYVYQEMSAFKFPGDDNIIFQCKVSFCDMNGSDKCREMIPPKCGPRNGTTATTNNNEVEVGPKKRIRRLIDQTKNGFALTVNVETRTLNVIENEAIRPPKSVRYCDVRN